MNALVPNVDSKIDAVFIAGRELLQGDSQMSVIYIVRGCFMLTLGFRRAFPAEIRAASIKASILLRRDPSVGVMF